jgi:arginine exporter protein ArgO
MHDLKTMRCLVVGAALTLVLTWFNPNPVETLLLVFGAIGATRGNLLGALLFAITTVIVTTT